MGLSAAVDLGGGMTLNASNAQNSDGLTDKSLTYSALTTGAAAYETGKTITDALQ